MTNPAAATVEDQPAHRAPAGSMLSYQPGLDGMRAIAILAVMVFHASFHAAALAPWGSWLGVDLFFVLSGFLITTLLLREFGANGRISLKNFYIRRVLRLYPMIVVCVVLALVLLVAPVAPRFRSSWLGIASIAGYFTNWVTVLRDDTRDLGLFAHLWSLSIEEQFYVVWPPVVIAVLRLRGRRVALAAVSAVLAVGVVALRYKVWLDARSFRMAHYFDFELAGRNSARAWRTVYYGSFTHTDGLLVGCLLAAVLGMHPRTPRRAVRWLVGCLAGCAVVVNVVIFRRTVRVPAPTFMTTWGFITFNVCTALILAHVLFSPRAPLPRLLSLRPLVWIGRRSYGLYVLHILVLSTVTNLAADTVGWLVVALALTFLLAALSYRYYEAPILKLKNRFSSNPAEAARARARAAPAEAAS